MEERKASFEDLKTSIDFYFNMLESFELKLNRWTGQYADTTTSHLKKTIKALGLSHRWSVIIIPSDLGDIINLNLSWV